LEEFKAKKGTQLLIEDGANCCSPVVDIEVAGGCNVPKADTRCPELAT